MPGCGDLGVYASFDYVLKRTIVLENRDEHRSIQTIVEGEETTSAYPGDSVTVKASASEGYEFAGIRGENTRTGETLFETEEDEATFTMPDSDVHVYVLCDGNKHNITIDNASAGHMTVQLLDDNGNEMTEFHNGSLVRARPVSIDGIHALDGKLSAKTAGGIELDVRFSDEDMYFTMPDEDVVISLSEGIQYADENGTTQVLRDYQSLSAYSDQLGVTISSGWYVVEGAGWGFNNRLTVTGEVNIVLTDNCHLILNRGIRIYDGGSLSIWSGPQGTGRMDCVQAFETNEGKAGIGGDKYESGGTFNLHGGIVNAVGQSNAAGIGGGKKGDGGAINIYGGTLNATGGGNAAGIGGGQFGNSGVIRIYGGSVTGSGGAGSAGGAGIGGGEDRSSDICIYGGTVNATGGNGSYGAGAGIGGGDGGNGGSIYIHGGNITASGGNWAAGIGGGNDEDGGSIYISGGDINATGGNGGAGIGGGDDGHGGTIVISDGNVHANGGKSGAGIGSGEDGRSGSITILGGYVFAHGGIYGAGIGTERNGVCEDITIRGGTVDAYGASNYAVDTVNGGAGAGIGGGNEGDGGKITINGGKVNSVGGWNGTGLSADDPYSGAGIGGGDDGDSGIIEINGGDIYAAAYCGWVGGIYSWAAGIGAGDDADEEQITINGGNISAHGNQAIGCGLKGDNGTIVLGDNVWSSIDGNVQPYADRYKNVRAHNIDLVTR